MERLPNETLTTIGQIIEPNNPEHDYFVIFYGSPGPSDDILALSCSSKRLKGIAEPFLYATATLRTTKSILQFLRTMIQRPDLTSLVKNLYINGSNVDTYERKDYRQVHNSCAHLIEEQLSKNNRDAVDNAKWAAEIGHGSWNSLVSLLLILLPNLKFVSLHPAAITYMTYYPTPYGHEYDHEEWTTQDAQPPLFRPGPSSQVTPAHHGMPPSLTKVLLHPMYEREDVLTLLGHFGQLGHIEEIVFRDEHLRDDYPDINSQCLTKKFSMQMGYECHPAAAAQLIMRFPLLEDFKFEIWTENGFRPPRGDEEIAIPFGSIVRGLVNANAQALKKLTLITSQTVDIYHGEQSIQSMATLKSLTTIDVPAFDTWMWHPSHYPEWHDELRSVYELQPVLGIDTPDSHLAPIQDILPSSIETVSLQHARRITVFHVFSLLTAKEMFPNLKTIDIEFTWDYSEATCFLENSRAAPCWITDTAELKEHGMRSGVVINCTFTPRHPWEEKPRFWFLGR